MLRPSRLARAAACLAALLLFPVTEARAQGWRWTLTPYVWTTDVGLDLKLKDKSIVSETIAFTDLIEDLDAAMQIRFEGRNGAHGIFADLFFVGLSKEAQRFQLPNGTAGTITPTMRMSILDGAGTFSARGNRQSFTLLYGTRIIVERVEIETTFDVPPATSSPASEDTRDTLIDALIGARYSRRLLPRWSVTAHADASAGATDYTWSAGTDLAFHFGAADRFAITAGYRRMDVQFKSELPIENRMTMSGFVGGFRMAF
jgi:hypothetical protein